MAGNGVPLAHLWFLYYLMLFYAIMLVCRWALRIVDRKARLQGFTGICLRSVVQSHTTVLVVPIPLIVSLCFASDWLPWTGIPTPQLGLTPHHSALTAFGSAFILGWFLHRQQYLLQCWARVWLGHCIVAMAASAASIWMVGLTGDPSAITGDTERITYAVIYALAAWSWVIAIVGFGVRFLSAPNPVWRYLSDSSYWMYLVHLPLAFGLQVAVMKWPMHWSVKFPLIVGVTFVLLLASYRAFVRNTFIGQLLNGRRYPKTTASSSIEMDAGDAGPEPKPATATESS